MGPMPVQACSQRYTLVAIVTHWQREASVVLRSIQTLTTPHWTRVPFVHRNPQKTPSPHLSGASEPLCADVCECECEWVGMGE